MNINIKNYKIYLVPIIIMFLVPIIIATFILNGNRLELYINWKVFLPQPEKVDDIFCHEYSQLSKFEIWQYNSKKAKTIISNKQFLPMDSKFIKEKLEVYNDSLGKERKYLFNKYIDDAILKDDNYYLYISEKITAVDSYYINYIILVLDTKTNKLYIFSRLRNWS